MEPKANKNEALEALDFIINVLKEHEKDLDRLIGQLGIITESLGETGEITEKIEGIEDKISDLQFALSNLGTSNNNSIPQKSNAVVSGPTKAVNVKCRKWEDFKAMANCAETVSYIYKTSEETFKATALKNGKLVSYSGEFPANSVLLKFWLSKELNVNEDDVFEGVLDVD